MLGLKIQIPNFSPKAICAFAQLLPPGFEVYLPTKILHPGPPFTFHI